jgi:putative transposase
MPSTHLCLSCHLVFSTKDRRPLVNPDWRDRLHAYLGGTIRSLGECRSPLAGREITFIC